MMNFKQSFGLLMAVGACVFVSIGIQAAEINSDPSVRAGGGAVLEGKIARGDYEKVKDFIFAPGKDARSVTTGTALQCAPMGNEREDCRPLHTRQVMPDL